MKIYEPQKYYIKLTHSGEYWFLLKKMGFYDFRGYYENKTLLKAVCINFVGKCKRKKILATFRPCKDVVIIAAHDPDWLEDISEQDKITLSEIWEGKI